MSEITDLTYYQRNRDLILNKKKSQKKDILRKKSCWLLCIKKEAIKEKSRERYKNLSKEEKDKIKEFQRKRYQELVQYKKELLINK